MPRSGPREERREEERTIALGRSKSDSLSANSASDVSPSGLDSFEEAAD